MGKKLGSPLRDKVESFVIHPFAQEEIELFHTEISNHFNAEYQELYSTVEKNALLEWYYQLISGYSGGHARTLARLSDEFLKEYSKKTDLPENLSEFLNKYTNLSDANRFYPNFTSRIEENIKILQKKEDFNKIHNWIVNLAIFGQNLGKRPEEIKLNKNTEHITNELVQMGVLMINGKKNYYLTSYFHLLAYLNAIQDKYSIFLNEILTNKYFKLMCGYHSGLGFVFEEILLATFMELKSDNIIKKIPFDISISYDVVKLQKSVNYTTLNLEKNTIYHTPLGAKVDFIISSENKIVLIQATTIQTVDLDKIQSVDEIYHAIQNKHQNFKILKWFVSLAPIKESILKILPDQTKSNLLITADEGLKEIIGREMFERVKSVKEEFRNPEIFR